MATNSDSSSTTVSTRLRTGLALVQSQLSVERARSRWSGIPDSLRAALRRAASRVRDGLDIPSKSELTELLERVEAMDRKLSEAEAARSKQVAILERKLADTQKAPRRTRKKAATDAPPRRAKSKANAKAKRAEKPTRKKTTRRRKSTTD